MKSLKKSQASAGSKPEAFTSLKGSKLVRKDHPAIILRGKLDSLAAHVINAQVCAWQSGQRECVEELQEALELSRTLLTCEYLDQKVGEFKLAGLDTDGLRECSHNPMKFFGHRHMLMDYRMGPLCAALNNLRTFVRETEVAAVMAFASSAEAEPAETVAEPAETVGGDIIRALNRLSSFFYILMYKYLPTNFEPESAGI